MQCRSGLRLCDGGTVRGLSRLLFFCGSCQCGGFSSLLGTQLFSTGFRALALRLCSRDGKPAEFGFAFGTGRGGGGLCGRSFGLGGGPLDLRGTGNAFGYQTRGGDLRGLGFLFGATARFLSRLLFCGHPRKSGGLGGLLGTQSCGNLVGGTPIGGGTLRCHPSEFVFRFGASRGGVRQFCGALFIALSLFQGSLFRLDACLNGVFGQTLRLHLPGHSFLFGASSSCRFVRWASPGISCLRNALLCLDSRTQGRCVGPLRVCRVWRRALASQGELPALPFGFHQSGQQLAQGFAPCSGRDSGNPGEAAYPRPGAGRR